MQGTNVKITVSFLSFRY